MNAFRVPSGTLQSLGASQQALRGSSCFSYPSPVEPNALTALDWFWSASSRTSASPRGYSMALSAVLYSSRPMFCRNPRFLVHGVPLNLMVRAEEFSRSYSFRPTAFVIEEPPDIPYSNRRATVREASGNIWQIAARPSDVGTGYSPAVPAPDQL